MLRNGNSLLSSDQSFATQKNIDVKNEKSTSLKYDADSRHKFVPSLSCHRMILLKIHHLLLQNQSVNLFKVGCASGL